VKKTKYLYGDLDSVVIETQKSVAKAKIEACQKLIGILYRVPLEARDDERLDAVVKAREFNQKLLDEEI